MFSNFPPRHAPLIAAPGDGARARDASEKRGGAAGRLAAFARFTSDGARDDPNGTSGGDPAAALRSISPSVLNSFYWVSSSPARATRSC